VVAVGEHQGGGRDRVGDRREPGGIVETPERMTEPVAVDRGGERRAGGLEQLGQARRCRETPDRIEVRPRRPE
jgi:hypothetical protein